MKKLFATGFVMLIAVWIWSSVSVGENEGSVQEAANPAVPFHGAQGKVLETFDSGGYTYILADTGSEKIWAASRTFTVKVGDTVSIGPGTTMHNFHSNTLDRTFDLIYFVPSIVVNGKSCVSEQVPAANPHTTVHSAEIKMDFSGIKKAANGNTVEEINVNREKLAGQTVAVRGKVVKFNPMIMGKNWLHIADGTGKEGSDDLTVTTKDTVKVGDTVLVRGKVVVDQDFGFGYQYAVLLEDASVTVE